MVAEEQAVVAQWGHGNADLSQVIQVLQDGGLGGGRSEGLVRQSGCWEGMHAGSRA